MHVIDPLKRHLTVELAVLSHCHSDMRQLKLMAKLIGYLCDNGHIKCNQLEDMLGTGFEVEID